MDPFFQGKRALVTGAASGIGRGIAIELASKGAHVIALDKNEDGLISLKEEVPCLEIVIVDLVNWTETKKIVQQSCPIDLLVNNAGVGSLVALTDLTEEEINYFFDVNTKAVINVTQTVVADLLKRNTSGSIVNMSSEVSLAAISNVPLYCATKGALDGFTRAMALDYGSHNIRINCVNPTIVKTNAIKELLVNSTWVNNELKKIPLGRFAEISDVVDVVVFLLSDKSKMITGTCVPVDGGFIAC